MNGIELEDHRPSISYLQVHLPSTGSQSLWTGTPFSIWNAALIYTTIQRDHNVPLLPDGLSKVLECIGSIHDAAAFAANEWRQNALRNIQILVRKEVCTGSEILFYRRLVHNLKPHRFDKEGAIEFARFQGFALQELTTADLNGFMRTATTARVEWFCRYHRSSC